MYKNYFKLFAVVVLVTLFSAVNAQQRKGHSAREDRKGEMLEMMQKQLDLTNDQVAKIKKVDEKYAAEEKALQEQQKALREKQRALMDKKKAEVEKVLTPEQKQKLDEFKAKRQDMRKDRRENRQDFDN